jgi:DNA-binding response OmpR family regulator
MVPGSYNCEANDKWALEKPNEGAAMPGSQALHSNAEELANMPSASTEDGTDQLGIDLDGLSSAEARRRVLIVDDDPDTIELLKLTVRSAGMDVTGALNAKEALAKCVRFPPDILLLDLMMPDMDGWSTLERLRKVTDAPVVVVSAKATKEEVVEGLDSGADDYITKPFYPPELVSRVKAVLRRSGAEHAKATLVFPEVDLAVDASTQQVEFNDRSVDLSAKEFAVFYALARRAPKPVRYETIAVEVWGEYAPKIQKRVKFAIHNIRRKLHGEDPEFGLIENKVGIGYQLNTNQAED